MQLSSRAPVMMMKRFTLFCLVATTGFAASIAASKPADGHLLPEIANQATTTGQMADTVEDSLETVLERDEGPSPTEDSPEEDGPEEDGDDTTVENSEEEGPVEETTVEEEDITEPEEDIEEAVPEDAVPEEAGTEPEDIECKVSEEEEATCEEAEEKAPALTETERIRRKLLIQGDNEYLKGNLAAAEALYRQAKDESWLLPQQFAPTVPEPFSDETQLSPAGGVYWREAQSGIERDRTSQTLTALSLLTTEAPAFIPGQVQYAIALQADERPDEAIAVLEEALTTYPEQADLLLAQVDMLMDQEQWIEAAIASRQFVALNSEHPAAPEQTTLAADNLQRFQRKTRSEIRDGAITNAFTGILGYAITGSVFGPFTAANSAIMLLQGENAVGNQFANRIQQQLPMLQHPEANGYIRQLGNRLSRVTGRNDLDYEFFVILDPTLNAFALPGGKIFVNAGAILKTDSEAELAGLLAHELSHSVLSHGFQIATRGNLSSSVAQYLPYGGLINNVFLSGYSRSMERQADIVGTQILAAGGYAADGLHNVMVTLDEEATGPRPPEWIASHPNPEDRVEYLRTLVDRGGYNRYAYEGVATHEEIQAIVARELATYEAQQEEENTEVEIIDPIDEEEQVDLYDAVERFDW
ncbi:MAG: M48 family metalloprotease [Cyanobacteria bacterium P01_F01_bin.53]